MKGSTPRSIASGMTSSAVFCSQAPLRRRFSEWTLFPRFRRGSGAPADSAGPRSSRSPARQSKWSIRGAIARAARRPGETPVSEERLAVSSVTRKYVTQHLPLVDALDLRGERRHLAMIGMDTGPSQDHDWHRAARGSNDGLCGRLGLRIRPLWPDRPVLADWHARMAGRMDEHRTRVDELPDLEGLQRQGRDRRPARRGNTKLHDHVSPPWQEAGSSRRTSGPGGRARGSRVRETDRGNV